jgi:signal transduction histidine kinase
MPLPRRQVHGRGRLRYPVNSIDLRHAFHSMTASLQPQAAAPSDAADDATELLQERAARHATEAALATREALLGILAHDLRGPLNTIQTWVHVLEAQLGAAAQQESAQRAFDGIRAGVTRQVQLLDTHVDAPRTKLRERDTPHPGHVNAIALLERSTRLARAALADARQVRIDVAASATDMALHTDADRLEQVLWTLLIFATEASAAHTAIHVNCMPSVLDEYPVGHLPALLQTPAERAGGAVPACRFTIEFDCDAAGPMDKDLPHVLEVFARETALTVPDGRRAPFALACCEKLARALGGALVCGPLAHGTVAQLVLTVPVSA